MHVFTYGTLMYPKVWQAVVGKRFTTIEGEVYGYSRHTIRGEVYPGIAKTLEPTTVKGLLYLDVDHHSLNELDRFEGDMYHRKRVSVHCLDEILRDATCFVVPDANRKFLSEEVWTPEAFEASGNLEHFLLRYDGFVQLREDE